MSSIHNPNCDGGHCLSETGEVRVLPLNRDPYHGNLILCRTCYEYEMRWRRERNLELDPDVRFDLPNWSDLKVYGNG